MLSPNGVGLSPDEKTVYVADTRKPLRLFAFDIVEPGAVRKEAVPLALRRRLICGRPVFSGFDSTGVGPSEYWLWRP